MYRGALLARISRAKIEYFVNDVARQTVECGRAHRCHMWPFEYASVLCVLAGGLGCKRILELGCGLGFATLWLAYGAKGAHIDTIDNDPLHVQGTRDNVVEFGVAERVTVMQGSFADILPTLVPFYDLAMFDGWAPMLDYLPQFERLIRKDGVLVSSNLIYASSTAPEADKAAAYIDRLYSAAWYTCLLDDNTAMSVRQ